MMDERRVIEGRELDGECAHAMGYFPCGCGNPTCDLWEPPAHLDTGGSLPPVPAFSTDPAAARLLEDEIERRGRRVTYITCLVAVVLPGVRFAQDGTALYPALTAWALIRATPEQKARAFLEAVH